MTVAGLCALCNMRFHGNCRPYVCQKCKSLTHRRCAGTRLNDVTEFLCVTCTQEESGARRKILPPGRALIPSEDVKTMQELTARQNQLDPSLHPTVNESSSHYSPFIDRADQMKLRIEDSSEDESADSEDESAESSTSHNETLEVESQCNQTVSQSILKSLISGIRGNFLAFLLVLVVSLAIILAFIAFFIVRPHVRGPDVFNFQPLWNNVGFQPPTSVPPVLPQTVPSLPVTREAFLSDDASTLSLNQTISPLSVTKEVTSTVDASTLRSSQIISLTDFVCTKISSITDLYICLNDIFESCVIVTGSIPQVPIRIRPMRELSKQYQNICQGKNIFEVSA